MAKRSKIRKILDYLVGNYRHFLYYRPFLKKRFMRQHIAEQIFYRIKSMDKKCFYEASCKECGCKCTELQMCNSPCEGGCYPEMLDKFGWKVFKSATINRYYIQLNNKVMWRLINSKFEKK